MRFQSIVLAAVAALGSTVVAQSSVISSAESAASSAVSSATSSVASSVRSSSGSSSSDASSTSSAASSSSASSSVTSSSDSSSVTSSASSAAASSSGSSDDDEEPTSTRVYTTTYYYLTENPTHKAVSPTLFLSSVVKSTSGAINQESFSTPTGSVTMLTIAKSTYTTTITSTNRFHDPVSKYFTNTEIVTTTMGLPFTDTSSSDGAAGKVSAREIGGVAAFFLGIAGMYL